MIAQDIHSDTQGIFYNQEPKSNKVFFFIFILVMVVGLSLTWIQYFHFKNLDHLKLQERLDRGIETLTLYANQPDLNTAITDVFTKLSYIQSEIENNPSSIADGLEKYLWDTPPSGLETTTLEYLARIEDGKVNSLNTYLSLTENADFPILEETDQGLQPAKNRHEYFPVALEASYDDKKALIGLDRSSDSIFRIAMAQSIDSGELTSKSSFPLNSSNQNLTTHYFLPLYEPGSNPTTIEERRRNHIGFISAVSYYEGELFTTFLPEDIKGIETTFFTQLDNALATGLDLEIQEEIESGDLRQIVYEFDGNFINISAKASKELIALMKTSQSLWALITGLSLTFSFATMILWSRYHSRKIIKLVNERTRDLVERTQNLKESESRYRVLADNVTDVIFTHDLDGICTYISPSITKQNGYTVKDYIGFPIYKNIPHPDCDIIKKSIMKTRDSLKDDPEFFSKMPPIEFNTNCIDGTTKPVETTISPLFSESGELTGYLGLTRDLTERKKAEKEKAALEDTCRQAQKMESIGTLAGGIAHDFNNILTGILGHAEMLKFEVEGNIEAEEGLDVIEKAAIQAKELTSQLLGFARKGQYQSIPVNIDEVMEEVVTLVERTIDKNIEISQTRSEVSPVILGDPSQINQIFLNLAVNAKDAMPDGGKLFFKTEVVELDSDFCEEHYNISPGDYCAISVTDTGIGIPSENIDKIFDPFFTDKDEGKGTGMGLAMVYGVTKSHHGVITVYSEVGKGTTFRVYLPISKQQSKKIEFPKHKDLINGSGNILVVDDQKIVRELAEKMLKKLGYSVFLANDGYDAVEYYKQYWQQIDVAIIDMIMPKMGGVDCLEEMKLINPQLKAIFSTGFSKESISEKINQESIQGFIQKPFRIQELSEVVAKVA